MARFRGVAGFAVALTAWVAAVTWTGAQSAARPGPTSPAAAQTPIPGAVPAATCAKCHASIHQRWLGARHSKMLQPATPATVLAPFSGRAIELRGTAFTLTHEGDRYFVRGPFPTAKEEVHRVEYTLGSRRVQHYLTRLSDGRLVVLPPAWDVEKGEWFHNLDIVNPDDAALKPDSGLEPDLLRVPRLRLRQGIRSDALELRHAVVGLRNQLRALSWSRRGSRRTLRIRRAGPRRGHRHRDAHAPVSGTLDDGVCAVSFAARHYRSGICRGRRLLRSLHADSGVRTTTRAGSCVLGGWPAAPILKRCNWPLAEPLLSRGQCDVHDLPSRSA